MKFRIQNFQSIIDETFEFESLTSIVGPTDRGKSAIFRALKSLLYNEWEEGFLRRGTKKCILTATFPEKYPISQVIQEKGKNINSYLIKFKDGRKDKFIPKVGIKVPEELKLMGFEIIETERKDKFNLNFHTQYDPLFLVAQPEPLVTSFFNHVFKITKYERALRKITADSIKLGKEYKENEKKIEKKQNDLKKVKDEFSVVSEKLENFKGILKLYDTCLKEIEKCDEGIVKLNQLQLIRREVIDTQNSYLKIKEFVDLISKYLDYFTDYMYAAIKMVDLINLNMEMKVLHIDGNNLGSRVKELENYLDKFNYYIDFIVKVDSLVDLSNGVKHINTVEYNLRKLNYSFDYYYSKYIDCLSVVGYYEMMFELEEEIKELKNEFNNIDEIFKYFSYSLMYKNDLELLYIYRDKLLNSKYILNDLLLNTYNLKEEYDKVMKYEDFIRSIIKTCPLCQSILKEKHDHGGIN